MLNNNEDLRKVKQLQNLYNTLTNFFWSILCILPVYIFCYNFMPLKLLYIFLAISILPVFIPNSLLNKIQLSKSTKIYKTLGVHRVNKFTQNGDLINRIIRKKYPGFKVVSFSVASANKLYNHTYANEKFHYILFIFYCLSMVYALVKNHPVWALVFLLCNVLYNVYPILLQQYIRIKLRLYINRKNA